MKRAEAFAHRLMASEELKRRNRHTERANQDAQERVKRENYARCMDGITSSQQAGDLMRCKNLLN